MKLLQLPPEILTLILNLLSPKDASHFARTSRHAYDLAIRRVLEEVVLGNLSRRYTRWTGPRPNKEAQKYLKKIKSFVELILSKRVSLATSVRSLKLFPMQLRTIAGTDHPPAGKATMKLLANAMSNMRNLQHIHIGDLNGLLKNYPAFQRVLAGYKGLQSVSFDVIGTDALAVIRNMHSRPRRIELSNITEKFIHPMFEALRTHVDSLETLALMDIVASQTLHLPDLAVWSRVRALDLGGDLITVLPIATRAFPNITRLSAIPSLGRAVQDGTGTTTWPTLDDAFLFTDIPLRSHVRHLRLGLSLVLSQITPPQKLDDMSRLLQDTRPSSLSIYASAIPEGFSERVARLEGQTLRYVEITFVGMNLLEQSLLIQDFAKLADLHLIALALGYTREDRRRYHRNFNYRTDAAKIAHKLTSVELVGFFIVDDENTDGERYERRWFRARQDEGRSVDEVPASSVADVTRYVENLGRDDRDRA